MALIGVSIPRRDCRQKVAGAARYAADARLPGLLHCRLVLAHQAHAKIASIRTDAALRLHGVVAVLRAGELPIAADGPGRAFEPLAREEVVYAGQPVAIVVAEDEATAEDGAELVELELVELEPVLNLEAAARPGAVRARAGAAGRAQQPDAAGAHAAVGAAAVGEHQALSENVLGSARLADGDVDALLAASELVVHGRFCTPWMYQGYLEPQVATAWLEDGEVLVVSSSTQGVFATRDGLARLFDLPLERVRVRAPAVGGGFGGKLMIIEPLVAGTALALGRPVRLAMTRSEDLAATNPAGAEVIDIQLGADRDGRLTAIRSRVLLDRGANEEYGFEQIAAMLTAGPYRWRAHELTCYGVQTNRVPFGAYRAPTAAPAAFALESLIDELAARLGADPLELRLRNVAGDGDRIASGQPLVAFGARACLERLRGHPLWAQRGSLPDGEGVGVAIGWWPGGYEPAAAVCRFDSDAHLTIITGAVDLTGTETVFAQLAAEAFGVEVDRVRVIAADTSSAPYAGTSSGSKVTYTVGRAVQEAAIQAREQLLQVAAAELEIAPEDLEIVGGAVQPVGAPDKRMALEQLAREVLRYGSRYGPIEGHGRVAQPAAPQTAAHLCHLQVDRDTGAVGVLAHVVAQDVGRALNPALVEGQMHGGAVQGLGWALWEELAYDRHGQLMTGTLVDYALPTATGVPAIQTEIVEVPAPQGPYGAKGVGEAPVVAAAAAAANAVAAATGGVRLRQLPMTPERVWRALRDQSR